jgi:hypothetical protein
MGAARLEPGAGRDEIRQGLRQPEQDRLADGCRQVLARQHGLADRRQVTVARHDAVERKRRDLGAVVLGQDQAGLGGSDFGDGGRDHARERAAAGDRGLDARMARADVVDQIGIEQQRRVFEHDRGDIRLVRAKRKNHRRRRLRAGTEHLGHGLAHQGRRIVEQHDERAFGGDAVVGRKIGNQEGTRQRPGRIGALARRGGAHPLEEMPNDHAATDATPPPTD